MVTVRKRYNAAQGLVDDGVDGFVVELGDREIAAGIEKVIKEKGIENIIKEEAYYKRLSGMSLYKAVEYNWDEIVGKICSVYEDRIEEK